MTDPSISFAEHAYSFQEILDYSGEEEALLFCQQWLGGQDRFEVKTSGSTGKPRTVTLSRNQMLASAKASAAVLQPKERDYLFLSLSPASIGGKMSLVRALEWQLPIHIIPATAQPFDQIPENHPYTICSLVPLQLHDIIKDESSRKKLERFRIILLGGAGIDTTLHQAIQRISPLVYHSFGMTETCSHIALKRLNGENPQAHFHPVPGVKISLSLERTLMIEADASIHNPLETNDLAVIHADGSFDILGRKDHSINSGGIKIQLDEMERLFAEVIPNSLYFCAGIADERLGEKLVIFIEGDPFPSDEVMQALKALAPAYKAPKALIFVPRFSRTATGKIDRIKISQQWAKTN